MNRINLTGQSFNLFTVVSEADRVQYPPEYVAWATRKEQSNNRRKYSARTRQIIVELHCKVDTSNIKGL